MRKRKKGFTLIELIAVIVILGILALVVVPLVLNIIRRAKDSTNKRSVDGYGRAVDLAIANYLVEHLTYPESFDKLEIEYSGSKVECKTSRINPDETVYLTECKVNGKLVKDDKEKDGYYHYGILKMTNPEYVDTYGKNLEDALKAYHDEHNEYPSDYTTLELPNLDKEVACDVDINPDGTVHLTNCKVDNEEVIDDNNEAYAYGNLYATTGLLKKTNSKSITTYTDGNTHEMYTFDHEATSQTPALTDYRYIGNEPYNYVTFNNELWRIIGVFTVENENSNTEQRLKLIKNEKLPSDMNWNSSYANEWETASLNTYLNVDYYNSLTEISKTMIAISKYYLGGRENDSNTHLGTASDMYSWERGTRVFPGNKLSCTSKIALMYSSDYTYTFAYGVDNICYNDGYNCRISSNGTATKSWIYNSNSSWYQWLISASPISNSNSGIRAFGVSSSGFVFSDFGVDGSYGVRPTLYLKSNVKIKSGDGSIDSPYEFEL